MRLFLGPPLSRRFQCPPWPKGWALGSRRLVGTQGLGADVGTQDKGQDRGRGGQSLCQPSLVSLRPDGQVWAP